MARKGLIKSIPKNIPDLEQPWPNFILDKATEITIGKNMMPHPPPPPPP